MKKVLVTGANGFLGKRLTKILSNHFILIGLTRSKHQTYLNLCENFNYYENKIEKIFVKHKIYAIIHLATIYDSNNDTISNLLETNIILPIKLYELGNQNNVKVFINSDTFFDNKKYDYLNYYTYSKIHAKEWLKLVNDKCKFINMKIFHMYGPNDNKKKFIPNIILKMNENKTIPLTDGMQKRDFIYVDDVANAFLIVLLKIDNINDNIFTFDIGTNKAISIKTLVLKIKNILNLEPDLEFGKIEYRKHENMLSIANNTELINLGWSPKIDLEKGLEKTIRSFIN